MTDTPMCPTSRSSCSFPCAYLSGLQPAHLKSALSFCNVSSGRRAPVESPVIQNCMGTGELDGVTSTPHWPLKGQCEACLTSGHLTASCPGSLQQSGGAADTTTRFPASANQPLQALLTKELNGNLDNVALILSFNHDS